MTLIRFIFFVWMASSINGVIAASESPLCVGPNFNEQQLSAVSCVKKSDVTAVEYSGNEPSGNYSTEFDKRRVLVVFGSSQSEVKDFSAIKINSQNSLADISNAIQPPHPEQIAKKNLLKSFKFNDWKIATKRFQYANQGGSLGFVIDCATAFKTSKKHTMVVSECYALEEKNRFLKTLLLAK
jgi:hypothetical protein